MPFLIALVAGSLIGLSLGALGSGGSILTVPVLVYLLGQSPVQATTGSLVVVGVTALVAAVTAHRAGNVLLGRGIVFGALAIAGAVAGSLAAVHVPSRVLIAAFTALMFVVVAVMGVRAWRQRPGRGSSSVEVDDQSFLAEPIIRFRPTFTCHCPAALKVLATATGVGLLTGFLGVGGGFLIVPALLLVLALPMRYAAGTSLVVITMNSATALIVRSGRGASPDWALVATLTIVSALAAIAGARLAARADTARLAVAFTGLVLVVAVATASRAIPALI